MGAGGGVKWVLSIADQRAMTRLLSEMRLLLTHHMHMLSCPPPLSLSVSVSVSVPVLVLASVSVSVTR